MKKIFNWFNFAILLAIIGFLLLIITAVWIVGVNKIMSATVTPIDLKVAANIGSYVGGVIGIFWSGAGVILIYATFKKQQEFNRHQLFEQTFNNLLNSYQTVVNNTREKVDFTFSNIDREFIGRNFYSAFLKKVKNTIYSSEFIEEIFKENELPEVKTFKEKHSEEVNVSPAYLITTFQGELKILDRKNVEFSKEFTIARYEYVYKQHQAVLGHYFRLIYNIFKSIIENIETTEGRAKYINLIQALMSNDELGILFYNAMSRFARNKEGKYKFKKWLTDYNFFENIDKDSLLNVADTKYYPIDYKLKRN